MKEKRYIHIEIILTDTPTNSMCSPCLDSDLKKPTNHWKKENSLENVNIEYLFDDINKLLIQGM